MGLFDTLWKVLMGQGMGPDSTPITTSTPAAAPPAAPGTSRAVGRKSIDDRFFRYGDFFGLFTRSPNKRWILSWRDSDPSGQRGGNRESGNGAYLLFDTEKDSVVVRGEMPRPNGGQVAENGYFSLEDWHFGNTLSGTFCVFDENGQNLIAWKMTANIVMSKVSSNGLYALCQTANSSTEDGNKLFFFDVLGRELLYSVVPKAGWAERYEIDDDSGQVIAHISELGAFRYDREGNFIDADRLSQAKCDSPRYESAIPAAEEILGQPDLSSEQAKKVLEIVKNAREQGADRVDWWKARALKVQGLAHEALGELREAVDAYDEALALNPKAGVKRRRDTLLKKLG